jgi:hypothetical protein
MQNWNNNSIIKEDITFFVGVTHIQTNLIFIMQSTFIIKL